MRKPKSILFLLTTVFIISFMNSSNLIAQDAPKRPQLFVGGGGFSQEMYVKFSKLAGPNAKLVVIPTATSREVKPEEIQKRWQDRGIKEVSVLHTRDKEVARSAGFADPLKTATVVWISGGSQSRIADAYLDTPVEEELYKLIERGGMIGGSSAGAAILSKMMISGGRVEPEITTGFDLVPGAIIDQHFLRRNRLKRLMAAIRAHPEMVGFGIDEDTAIHINGNEYKVIGSSYVMQIEMVEGKIQLNAYEDGETITINKE
ncbi:MAG: cyanophycinase [Bacteroidota bacterium]